MKTLVWFRRDLRQQDNPALTAGVASGLPVEEAFIYPQELESPLAEGTAARRYLHDSLQSLQQHLAVLGIPLHLVRGDPVTVLPRICREQSILQLYLDLFTIKLHCNRCRGLRYRDCPPKPDRTVFFSLGNGD